MSYLKVPRERKPVSGLKTCLAGSGGHQTFGNLGQESTLSIRCSSIYLLPRQSWQCLWRTIHSMEGCVNPSLLGTTSGSSCLYLTPLPLPPPHQQDQWLAGGGLGRSLEELTPKQPYDRWVGIYKFWKMEEEGGNDVNQEIAQWSLVSGRSCVSVGEGECG